MSVSTVPHPFEPFLVAADEVAAARPDEVDLEMSREVFREAAHLLHNGLALDDLDEHAAQAVVAGLCGALVDPDPGATVRELARTVLESPGDLHDPETVSGSYLVAASILRL